MKAISLHEPWASLIACGVKTIETRSWKPPESLIGQRIAIHAAKRKPTNDDLELFRGIDLVPFGYWIHGDTGEIYYWKNPERTSLGKVLATAVLAKVRQVHSRMADGNAVCMVPDSDMLEMVPTDYYGDFSPGRWLWMLEDIERLDPPIPAVGRQGFWNWEA